MTSFSILFVILINIHNYYAAEVSTSLKSNKKPNFVYVLTDDMGLLMGDEAAIPQIRKMVANDGAQFKNFFVSSPKCTPSRSAWLSGRYYHNLRPDGRTSGRGLNTTNFFDHDALFPTLHRNGYQTGIFGKIHNDQGKWLCDENNHTEPFTHIETECRPCGGYYRGNWVMKEDDDDVTHLFHIGSGAYSEAEYGNRSIAWMRKVAKNGKPFFVYVGTTGPHLGVVPAPWHRTVTEYLNITAPRTPNFNMLASDHFPLLASAPKLDDTALQFIDRHMRDRWGALFSIDDLVAGLITTLEEIGVLDNTYVLFSSDHGYHLGQFRIPDEKMLPYETDIRIPFYIRGPGIKSGITLNALAANVDVAPTILELANIPIPNIMDGKSMAAMLLGKPYQKWRTSFMSEFAEGATQKWKTNGMWKLKPGNPPGDDHVNPPDGPQSGSGEYIYDNHGNQWRLLRVLNETDNFSFIEFDPEYVFDNVTFREFYDLSIDPWQMHNIWNKQTVERQNQLRYEIEMFYTCRGNRTSPSNCV